MLKCLIYMQSGFLSPQKFKQDEMTKRTFNLQLSQNQDIENLYSSSVNSLALDTCEKFLLSGSSDGTIYIHNLLNFTGKTHHLMKCILQVPKSSPRCHKHSVESVSWFGNDNACFITSSTDKTLKIWDTIKLTPVETFKSKGRIFQHHCTAVPTADPVIAVGSYVNYVELIDLRTGCAIRELHGHSSGILSVQWSPLNEHLLASGGMDNRILLWDIRSSRSCLQRLDQYNAKKDKGTAHSGYINGLKFSSDGLLLLSCGTDNRLRLWETYNGNHQMINYGKIRNDVKRNVQLEVTSGCKPELVFIPSEGNVVVTEMLTGTKVTTLNGHFNSVNCCVYRRSYQQLYTGGNDRNVLLWTADQNSENTSPVNQRNQVLINADNWSSDDDDT